MICILVAFVALLVYIMFAAHKKKSHESGDIIYRRDLKVGYLEQSPKFDPEESVLEACFNVMR